VSRQMISSPVDDERVLEELEAEFLRRPSGWPTPSEVDLAETLAPATRRSSDEPVGAEKRGTMIRCPGKKTCCG
jgi:hypothetical protein